MLRLASAPDDVDRLVAVMATRIPTAEEIPGSRWLPVEQIGTRLWAGLLACWLALGGPTYDARTPLPMAFRFASTPEDVLRTNEVLDGLRGGVEGLRMPLVLALELLADRADKGGPRLFSWASLHHDLTHWSGAVAEEWRKAFFHPSTSESTTQPSASHAVR